MKRNRQHLELQKRIGQKIKQARAESRLTQVELAKHLKMTGPGLGYIEAGKRRIDLFMLEKIAKVVRKPLDYFFEQKKFAVDPFRSRPPEGSATGTSGRPVSNGVESKLLAIARQMKELRKLLMASRKSGGGGDSR